MFNWLPLSERKGISYPSVAIEENTGQLYSGYYDSSINHIVVVDYGCEKNMAATLAHEFRHACQYQLNQKYTSKPAQLPTDVHYELMLHEYFSKNEHELDALLFEVKCAKTELNNWWLNHLVRINDLDLLDLTY